MCVWLEREGAEIERGFLRDFGVEGSGWRILSEVKFESSNGKGGQ